MLRLYEELLKDQDSGEERIGEPAPTDRFTYTGLVYLTQPQAMID